MQEFPILSLGDGLLPAKQEMDCYLPQVDNISLPPKTEGEDTDILHQAMDSAGLVDEAQTYNRTHQWVNQIPSDFESLSPSNNERDLRRPSQGAQQDDNKHHGGVLISTQNAQQRPSRVVNARETTVSAKPAKLASHRSAYQAPPGKCPAVPRRTTTTQACDQAAAQLDVSIRECQTALDEMEQQLIAEDEENRARENLRKRRRVDTDTSAHQDAGRDTQATTSPAQPSATYLQGLTNSLTQVCEQKLQQARQQQKTTNPNQDILQIYVPILLAVVAVIALKLLLRWRVLRI